MFKDNYRIYRQKPEETLDCHWSFSQENKVERKKKAVILLSQLFPGWISNGDHNFFCSDAEIEEQQTTVKCTLISISAFVKDLYTLLSLFDTSSNRLNGQKEFVCSIEAKQFT